MTKQEINRYIHREIMQKCRGPEDCDCVPALYTSDDSPRRLLNDVVAKVDNDADVTARIVGNIGYANFQIRATAEQIARACVEAHKEATDVNDTRTDHRQRNNPAH